MLDVRADSIIYQSQVKLASLVDTLITSKRLGKQKDALWNKILLIRRYLKSLEFREYLEDIDQANYVLEQLIILTGINDFPAGPSLQVLTLPAIIVGQKGDTGNSITGPIGPTGLATDFSLTNSSVTANADNFTIISAKGARWDYVVISSIGDQRTGSVIATWKSDGSSIVFTDISSPDIGSTTGIEFSVIYGGGSISLRALITTGTWTVNGSRYFTPNNGNGSGPISGVLTLGKVYIGNASNQAAEQTLSGAITVNSSGLALLSNSAVLDTNIAAGAAIGLTKLAPMSFSQLVVTTGAGFLTTIAVTPVEAGYLAGVTSNIQTQLNSKLSGTGAISNYTTVNFPATNVVAISDGAFKLGVSSITTTELSYLSGASSNIQTQLNSKQPLITESLVTVPAGPAIKKLLLPIGIWDMSTVFTVGIAHGLPDITKIVGWVVIIRNDAGTETHNLTRVPYSITVPSTPSGVSLESGQVFKVDVGQVFLSTGTFFQVGAYSSTGVNRGYITIEYIL